MRKVGVILRGIREDVCMLLPAHSSQYAHLGRYSRPEGTGDDAVPPISHLPQPVQHAEYCRRRRVPVILVHVVAGAKVVGAEIKKLLHPRDNLRSTWMQCPIECLWILLEKEGGDSRNERVEQWWH